MASFDTVALNGCSSLQSVAVTFCKGLYYVTLLCDLNAVVRAGSEPALWFLIAVCDLSVVAAILLTENTRLCDCLGGEHQKRSV